MPSSDPLLRAKHRKDYYDRVKRDPMRYAKRKRQISESRKRVKEANPKMFLIYSARERAKKFNLPCTITETDFEIPSVCPILGIPIHISKGYASPNSPSLDRIDPRKGYIPNNVMVMSHRANRIKGDASIQELEAVIKFLKDYPTA